MLVQEMKSVVDTSFSNGKITFTIYGAIDNQKAILEMVNILEKQKVNTIEIDLFNVEYANTFLINGLARLKRQFTYPITIVGASASIKELLEISNITKIIAVY